jgi:hypothetical protein
LLLLKAFVSFYLIITLYRKIRFMGNEGKEGCVAVLRR